VPRPDERAPGSPTGREAAHPADDRLLAERPRLLGLGYRLTGSWADAEDIVQETFARWYRMSVDERAAIRSAGAWSTTVAGRLCLDLLGSARMRREHYVGEWIPEPVPDGVAGLGSSDPADRVVLDESLTMAFLVMLQSMTPAERVAFVLHDVFRYSFAEIGEILDRTPAAARQLASSARLRSRAQRPSSGASVDQSQVIRRLRSAWEANDIEALVGILDPDAVMFADGGGVVSAALRPIHGADAVARYFVTIASIADGLRLHERTVNGRPGLVAERGGVTITVAAFESTGERITRIWTVRNPDKLRLWAADAAGQDAATR
jgi:RNA polymerase sigma-70 factor (ECF subfamily)